LTLVAFVEEQQKQLTLAEAVSMGLPIVQSNGVGVDSVAVVVGMVARGIRPDAILFADVGNELPETYDYIPVLNEYLTANGFPQLQIVKYEPKKFKRDPYDTLETDCLTKSMLPSLAYGFKGCSNKWKVGPLDKWVKARYKAHLKAGGQVARLIGYDAGAKDCSRGTSAKDSKQWRFIYPLREWGWDRDECIRQIKLAGLPEPMKSACFFCPSTQKDELIWLAHKHPGLAKRAIQMEDKAQDTLTSIQGLWRNGIKGTRKPEAKRPGRWRDYLTEAGLIDRVMAFDDGEEEYEEYFV
jgi:hypothetical protein